MAEVTRWVRSEPVEVKAWFWDPADTVVDTWGVAAWGRGLSRFVRDSGKGLWRITADGPETVLSVRVRRIGTDRYVIFRVGQWLVWDRGEFEAWKDSAFRDVFRPAGEDSPSGLPEWLDPRLAVMVARGGVTVDPDGAVVLWLDAGRDACVTVDGPDPGGHYVVRLYAAGVLSAVFPGRRGEDLAAGIVTAARASGLVS